MAHLRVRRLTDSALVSFFIADALDVDRAANYHSRSTPASATPISIAPKSDPLHLHAHLNEMLRDVPVVLLHTYPFVRQAGYLASVYANVYVDLSLAITVMPHRGTELMLEALELTPATKLLFATDASRLPEVFLLATRWWRASLTKALGRLVDDDFLDLADALSWAQLILADNACRVYGVEPV